MEYMLCSVVEMELYFGMKLGAKARINSTISKIQEFLYTDGYDYSFCLKKTDSMLK